MSIERVQAQSREHREGPATGLVGRRAREDHVLIFREFR